LEASFPNLTARSAMKKIMFVELIPTSWIVKRAVEELGDRL